MAERDRSSPAAGFTLIEVLVAVSVLGLILAVLAGGVGFAGRAWQAQEARIAKNGDLDAVQSILRRLIASAHGFDGNTEALRFVGPLPAALRRVGLFECELRVSSGRLVLAWRPHAKPAQDIEATETQLAQGIGEFHVDYLMPVEGRAPEWHAVATADDDPPLLIRIALAGEGGRSWPTLVVAPAVEENPGGRR